MKSSPPVARRKVSSRTSWAPSRAPSPPSSASISAIDRVMPTGKDPGPDRRASTARRWACTMAWLTARWRSKLSFTPGGKAPMV